MISTQQVTKQGRKPKIHRQLPFAQTEPDDYRGMSQLDLHKYVNID